MAGTVIFNVGGKHFEVLQQTIAAHPATLLASMISGVNAAAAAKPIFIDANSDRFSHILDWYRYNEIFVPSDSSVQAVLRDARFFRLPDEVTINGTVHLVGTAPQNSLTTEFDTIIKKVEDAWDGFESYVERLVADARKKWAADVEASTKAGTFLEELADSSSISHHICLLQRGQWVDKENVSNVERVRLLCHELTRRGLECSVELWDALNSVYLVLRARTSTRAGEVFRGVNTIEVNPRSGVQSPVCLVRAV